MNQIITSNKVKVEALQKDSVYRIILDGKAIKTKKEFWRMLEEKFRFPEKSTNMNMFLDYFADLSWLDAEKIELIIYNKKHFLVSEKGARKNVKRVLKECVLSFWDGEVEEVVVGGKRKDFNVFFVDELIYSEAEKQTKEDEKNWLARMFDKFLKLSTRKGKLQ